MASRSYGKQLKLSLGEMIDTVDLPELQKQALRGRWLDQVLWMEGRADQARDRYYVLRLTTIVGGVIVPALVGINVSATFLNPLHVMVVVLSLVVAICAAVEEFFHYGERWRHYRRAVEWLKREGWQFFQLAGRYRRHESHLEAYAVFAARVEDVIQRDVDAYIAEVARDREPEETERDRDNERQPTP